MMQRWNSFELCSKAETPIAQPYLEAKPIHKLIDHQVQQKLLAGCDTVILQHLHVYVCTCSSQVSVSGKISDMSSDSGVGPHT